MSLFGTSPEGNGPISHALFDDDDDVVNERRRSAAPLSSSRVPFADKNAHDGNDYDGDNHSALLDPSGEHSSSSSSHWGVIPERRTRSRAEVLASLLPVEETPTKYADAYHAALRDDSAGPRGKHVGAVGVAKMFAAAKLRPDQQTHIMNVLAVGDDDDGDSGAVALDEAAFGVLLALVGLAQEGEIVSLDGVDDRRRSE